MDPQATNRIPADIPRAPLEIYNVNRGFLPTVGLHPRGHLYVQESSYAHWVFLAVMLVAALAVGLLPWHAETAGGEWKLKNLFALLLGLAGFCHVAIYWGRNAFGQTILIDPLKRILTIRQHSSEQAIPWTAILGLQICRQIGPPTSQLDGYQLNLVWRDAAGAIQRHCLLKHAIRSFVGALGQRYQTLFRFELFDLAAPAAGTRPAADNPAAR